MMDIRKQLMHSLIIEENIVDENKHHQGRQSTEKDIKYGYKLYHTTLLCTKGVSNNATVNNFYV